MYVYIYNYMCTLAHKSGGDTIAISRICMAAYRNVARRSQYLETGA